MDDDILPAEWEAWRHTLKASIETFGIFVALDTAGSGDACSCNATESLCDARCFCDAECTSDACQLNQWACRGGSQCIPVSYECDGVADCDDGSDEGSQCRSSP